MPAAVHQTISNNLHEQLQSNSITVQSIGTCLYIVLVSWWEMEAEELPNWRSMCVFSYVIIIRNYQFNTFDRSIIAINDILSSLVTIYLN